MTLQCLFWQQGAITELIKQFYEVVQKYSWLVRTFVDKLQKDRVDTVQCCLVKLKRFSHQLINVRLKTGGGVYCSASYSSLMRCLTKI